MQRFLTLTVAAAAALFTLSAQADLIDAKFTGTVDAQAQSTFAVGATVSGEFIYDTVTSSYLSFIIGGQSVAPGYASSASLTPDRYTALYQAQVSPVSGGALNSTFALDLEAITPWPSSDAAALLMNTAQLGSNLDTTMSNFSYYMADASGSQIQSLHASLGTLQVAVVPEPASLALLVTGLAAIGLSRRRRD